MIHHLFHHHLWTYIIVACIAGYFTLLFDMMKGAARLSDDYTEAKNDKHEDK
jgi:hypothetical protein